MVAWVVLNIVYSCVCSQLLNVMNVLGTCCGELVNGQVFLDEFYLLHNCVFFFSSIDTVHADPSISTSTPTPCYGDVVTLVCHHPDLASNPGRYITTVPAWREDGVGITPSTGIYLRDDTSEDHTHTTLTINITVDHFRNKSFNYSCFLVLAVPVGELETSGMVTVDLVGELLVYTHVYTCTVITSNDFH